MGERRGMKALELWCRRVTEGYPGVKIENMTTSWRDGLAFCALIHHFRPDLIDFDRLDKRDILKNNELAFRVAERQLGIPALLDAEDMVEYEIPDRLSILTYLSQFYQAFGQQGTSPSPRKHNSVQEILPSPTNSTVKVGAGRVERCSSCDRPVFLAERLVVGGKLRHRSCFSCARCGHQLNPVSCYETETGDFVCEMCPDEGKSKMNGQHNFTSTKDDVAEPDAPLPALPTEIPPAESNDVPEQLPPDDVPVEIQLPVKPPDPLKSKFLTEILDDIKTDDVNFDLTSGLNDELVPSLSKLECPEQDDATNSILSLASSIHLDNDNVKSVEELEGQSHSESDDQQTLEIPEECSKTMNATKTSDLDASVWASEDLEAVTVEKKDMIENKLDADCLTEKLNSDVANESVEKAEDYDEKLLDKEMQSFNLTAESSTCHDTSITVTDTDDSQNYPIDLNPFGDSEEEEVEENSAAPSTLSCRKVEVNQDGKTIVEAPKNLNPFWSESDLDLSDEGNDELPDKPTPAPRTLRTPEPMPRNRFGSSTSLTSQSSSTGKKKKRPAPQPPSSNESYLRRPSSPVSSLSSPSSYASRSPASTRRRKSRPAPPPPINFDKERKDYENKVKQNISPPDKSTYGKWKRKKGAAPGLPIPPQRRRIIVPVGDLYQEVEDLEVQQAELERQGVKLEQSIRRIEEDREQEGSSTNEKDLEEMVLQLFEIVNQKNELFRRQAELMFLRKQQRLEEEHADIEYQIRCLMGRPKDKADPVLEEELIRRLVDVVERRNEIIDCLDMNRKRAVEEDQSINDRLQAYSARDTPESAEEEPAPLKKNSKSVLKLIKKKHEKKKDKEELDKKKDLDVDIDESAVEGEEDKTKVKAKKKWFKLPIDKPNKNQ